MRGQYASLPYEPAATSDDAIEEIRSAIDEVRFSAEPARWVYGGVHRQPAPPEAVRVVPRFAFVEPIDNVDANTIVRIRGRAPLAFLQWFDEFRSVLGDQQVMLDQCRFKEAD